MRKSLRDDVVADGGLIHEVETFRSWASLGVYPFLLQLSLR